VASIVVKIVFVRQGYQEKQNPNPQKCIMSFTRQKRERQKCPIGDSRNRSDVVSLNWECEAAFTNLLGRI